MKTLSIALLAMLVVGATSGCTQPELVGQLTELSYSGDHSSAVNECVLQLEDDVEGRAGDYPESARVDAVEIRVDALDEVRTQLLIEGNLTLLYGQGEDRYRWECDVLQKWYTPSVTELRYTPRE